MDERFEEHLRAARGRFPEEGATGVAGGAACGDVVRVDVAVDAGGRVRAGADASGCGATLAAASAAVTLADGAFLLDAAKLGTQQVADELGGLSPGKLHAAELAADALARALGTAAATQARLPDARDRTLVAMSGGVDSAVAALLTGGERVAVTLELWRSPENDADASCCSASAVRRARALAHRMGLAHLTLDLREAFAAGVVEPWLEGHAAGETPNPCVRCNGSVRLDAMLDLAARLGCGGGLATGHYARTTDDARLRRARDARKDQSYVLAALPREHVARMRFPLGDLASKDQARALAREADLPVHAQPDSQDLCFLAGTGRDAFLERHGRQRARPGDVLDRAGRRIGRHRGHASYTVGQRRGLGLGGGSGEPLHVLATDAAANTVTVGPRTALATTAVAVRDLRLDAEPTHVQLRAHARPVRCSLDGDAVRLDEPSMAPAPGQACVFYDGDVVVGHATMVAPGPRP